MGFEEMKAYGLFGIIIALFVFVVLWLIPVRSGRMVVRTLYWEREVQEVEFYTTCTQGSTNTGTPEPTPNCDTHTRVVQRWSTTGEYPLEPVWPTNYYIRIGYYEQRIETYYVVFSDDRRLYNYVTSNYVEYSQLTPKVSYTVELNIFNQPIGVQR